MQPIPPHPRSICRPPPFHTFPSTVEAFHLPLCPFRFRALSTFAARRNVFSSLICHLTSPHLVCFHFICFRFVPFCCLHLFYYSLSFCYSIMNTATHFTARVKNIVHDSLSCAWLEVHKEFPLNFQFSQNSFNENMATYIHTCIV